MSVAEVTGRIDEIRAQFTMLTTPLTANTAASSAAVTSAGTAGAATSPDFAAALAAADGASAVPAGSTSSTGTAGQAIVDEARKYLGVPYVWGGTDPKKGLDCSGLVQLVYRKHGIDLPRVSSDQARAGRPVASLADARPGDILAFGSPVHHVGIYIGHHKMIEAPRTGLDVRVSDVYEKPTAIRRVLPDQPVASSASMSPASTSLGSGTPYASLFERASARYGVDASLLAAVAKQESGFNAGAVSPAGAKGLMQLMPSTARGLGVTDPFNPSQAVDGAARLLRDLIKEFGRVDLALAAYNAGPGAVHRYHGIPPYAETQRYVPAVLAHRANLEART